MKYATGPNIHVWFWYNGKLWFELQFHSWYSAFISCNQTTKISKMAYALLNKLFSILWRLHMNEILKWISVNVWIVFINIYKYASGRSSVQTQSPDQCPTDSNDDPRNIENSVHLSSMVTWFIPSIKRSIIGVDSRQILSPLAIKCIPLWTRLKILLKLSFLSFCEADLKHCRRTYLLFYNWQHAESTIFLWEFLWLGA